MSNFVSFNAKYYKHSQSSGEIGHVERQFAENKNQIKELEKNNFDCGYSIIDKYNEIYAQVETDKGKKIQKNANTFIDGVLAFSREQFEEFAQDPHYKAIMKKYINGFMDQVQEQTGLTPVGWAFHADEGYKDPETGEIAMNYHAQLIFFNHDFKTGKAPLRDMQKRGSESPWSKLQDLAGEVFSPLGFVRGKPKDDLHADHLEKDDYVARKHEELEKIIQENEELASKMAILATNMTEQCESLKDVVTEINSKAKAYEDIKNNIGKATDFIKKELEDDKSIYSKFKNVIKSKFPKTYDKLWDIGKKIIHFFDGKIPTLENTKELINEINVNSDEVTKILEEMKKKSEQLKEQKQNGPKKPSGQRSPSPGGSRSGGPKP
jgi:hypothetical protein